MRKNTDHLQNDQLVWIAIDFDETIATNSGYPDFVLQKPIPGAREAIKKLVKLGWKIKIFTARPSSDHLAIERWLKRWKIPYSAIYTGKILARYYVDDRNIEFKGNWDDVLKKIK